MANIKLNGNIQINVDDDGVFDGLLNSMLNEIKEEVSAIRHKGRESVKRDEKFALQWIQGEDTIGKVEVNYERI
jgi:hypothetical protein